MRWPENVTCKVERKCAYRILLRNSWVRDNLKGLGVDWRTIMNYLKEIVLDSVDCTDLAQDEHKWQAVVIAVMNMHVS